MIFNMMPSNSKLKSIFACICAPFVGSNNRQRITRYYTNPSGTSTPQEREDAELAENYAKEEEEAVEGESHG